MNVGTMSALKDSSRIQSVGTFILRYGLVLVIAWIGAMKFTAYEAAGVQPLVATSPLMSWMYQFLSVQGVSNLLGVVEISVAAMIAMRPVSARISAIGSGLAVMMFLTTLTFLFSLPGWEPSLGGFPALSGSGGFLLKDVLLLGAAVWTLGEAMSNIKVVGIKKDSKMRTKRVPTSLQILVTLAIILQLFPVSAAEQGSSSTTYGKIVRFDPRFDKLVPPDAALEKIADGFAWVEGPVWNRKGGYLLFSDIPNNSVFKWQEDKGVSLFLKPSGYTGSAPFEGREPGSNGLTFDSTGRFVLCEHGDRDISRLEENGNKTTLVDRYKGKRLNSPNDVVFKLNGDLYFTDPPFGLPKAFDDPNKELPFQGVYRLSADGKLTLLTEEIKAPNGIAFSPDEKTLYVTDVNPNRPAWLAFDVKDDGTITNGRVFFDATPFMKTRKGGPDGLKLDKDGNLFAAGPEGVYVFASDGTHLGIIETGVPTSNVNWGNDGSVLYVTASTAVYRIRLSTKGAGF